MRFTTIFTAALGLVPTILANKFSMNVQYTDALVDVGDLDIFWSVWNRMYDVSDARGGLSDITRQQTSRGCYGSRRGPNLSTRVILDGQWGAVTGVNGWQMRDALIGTMWRTVQELAARESYNVYRDCVGFTWQEGTPNRATSACGPVSRTKCPNDGIGGCRGVPSLECERHSTGHRLPSIVRVNVYNSNGSLRADMYQARISSASTSVGSGGCGKAGAIAEVLLSFVPGVGTYFERGVKIACRQGGLK